MQMRKIKNIDSPSKEGGYIEINRFTSTENSKKNLDYFIVTVIKRQKFSTSGGAFAIRDGVFGKTIWDDTQEVPQSSNPAFPRNQKKERWGTNNDQTNPTYETAVAQRTAATEE